MVTTNWQWTEPHAEPRNKRPKAEPWIADTNEVRIEKVETSEEICFQPIATEWRSSRLKALGLNGRLEVHPLPKMLPKTVSVLEPPKNSVKIEGDGNCYFRTISHLLTGSQDHHLRMRNAVSDYILENDGYFSHLDNSESYFARSEVAKPGVWATDMEIMATSAMLHTDIVIFSSCGKDTFKWLTYRADHSKLKPLGKLRKSGKKLYICNMSDHFTPVYEV